MAGNVGHDRLGVPQPGGGDPLAGPGHGLVGDIGARDVTARSARAARSSTVVPLPQPMSSTCSPGWGAAISSSVFVRSTTARSIRSYWSAHAREAALFQNSIWAAFRETACRSDIVVPLRLSRSN